MIVEPSGPSTPDSTSPKKAGWIQVARTIFWGLFMIGRKGTWEKDGAVVSLPQIIVGAFIGLAVVLAVLIGIVRMVLR